MESENEKENYVEIDRNIKDIFVKYQNYIGYILSYILGLILIFSPIWQLMIISAIVGGLCVTNSRTGAKVGAFGIVASWLTYIIYSILISNVEILMNQVAQIIFGVGDFGFVLIVIILVLGGIIGAFSGVIGSSIRAIIIIKKDKDFEETKPKTEIQTQ